MDQAYTLLERVAAARPYESQTYHALAQCLAAAGNVDLAIVYFEIAVSDAWNQNDFDDTGPIDKVAAVEYLPLLKQVERGEYQARMLSFARLRQASLQEQLGMASADLVAIVWWNTDGTDIDLHVAEPTGEVCYYDHNKTEQGGMLTRDITTGFGPEMYVLPKAASGKYQIQVKYFDDDDNRASTRTRVFATVYTHWGTDREQVHRATVTLQARQKMHHLLTIEME